MFYLYQSNRLERLFSELCALLASPVSGPLVAEEIVVQNPGTARWLSRQIALHQGIAANLEFPLPARFVWRIFASQLNIPDDAEDLNRQALLWRIFQLLATHRRQPDFAEIGKYLEDDRDGRKTFQLAGRAADLFDQYLVYRPEMVAAWENGESRDWQAVLWRKLTARGTHHRAGLLQNFREKYRAGALVRASLPDRIIVFGISSLAPAYLEVMHAVSTLADVHLFHLSPCRSYWFDLVSDKDLARKRSGWRRKNLPDVSEYYETGNSLLASLGAVGREFSLQLTGLDVVEKELYEVPEGDCLLACLQRDILDLPGDGPPGSNSRAGIDHDPSVQFHVCHSRTREIQVLHDRLLELFERDSGLKPGDVLIMAPDIEAYDSPVRAVFDSAVEERFIPWSLADRPVRSDQPLAESFLALFELLTGRFEAPEVIAFLESSSVLRKFAIDEAGIGRIRTWVRESGIRWGLDAEQRRHEGCAMSDLHSWGFGLKRMLLGYMTGAQAELFQGIAPFSSLAADDSLLLGRLAAFFDRLRTWSERMQAENIPAEWARLLFEMLDDFFAPGGDEGDIRALLGLRETTAEWLRNCQAAGITEKISMPVIRDFFTEILSTRNEGQPFLSGRVTFCNMVPMRSLPFKVVWLLGMNDTDYPRSRRPPAFDLISRQPKIGDRNRRSDDCYLFLEALVSARKVFSVSWVGRDQQDNSIRAPSVVVSLLLEYVKMVGREVRGDAFVLPLTEHPLQPFSSRCFDGTESTASYAAEWLPRPVPSLPPAFLPDPLPPPDATCRILDIKELVGFWRHPVQYFLRERLGLDVREQENLLPEKEPFQADSLERYFLVSELTTEILQGRDAGERYPRLQASGRLPHGSFGRNVFEEACSAAKEFVSLILPFAGECREDIEVDLTLGGFHLTGWLDGLGSNGLVRYRSASLKCSDMLRLWIEHLVYNLAAPEVYQRRSFHIAADAVISLRPVADPRTELERLLGLYLQGMRTPLPFYPKTSQACFLAREKNKPFDPRKTWDSGFRFRGEGEDPAYRLAFRGIDPFVRPFAEHAMTVYAPLYSHLEQTDAAV